MKSTKQLFLEPQVWKALNQAEDIKSYAQNWLALLCASIENTECGVLVLKQKKTYTPISFWPDKTAKTDSLMKAANSALENNQGVCRQGDSGQIAYPLQTETGLHGVVALEIKNLNSDSAPLAMRLLQWGLAGLLLTLYRTNTNLSEDNVLRKVLDCVVVTLENQGFHQACLVLVTHLANTLNCDRVTIGFTKYRYYHIEAFSYSVAFSEKTQLSRALEAAMTEASDMERCIVFPSPKDNLLYPSHEQLATNFGGNSICTVPINNGGKILGVLILERKLFFDQETVQICETSGTMAGLVLDLKKNNEQGWLKRLVMQIRNLLAKILGSKHLIWKLNSLLLIVVITFFSVTQTIFRISADAYLEGKVQQVVVAAIDGYIKEASVRHGDLVEENDPLFELKDEDLNLERTKLNKQLEQYEAEYRNILSQKNGAEIRILQAKIEQTKVQLELIKTKLKRTKGYAPFAGIVVSGDLTQKINSSVKRGDVLFEIAPLNHYRIILEIDEKDIAEIKQQQTGNLLLTSLTGKSLPFEINKITPVSETKEGINYFRVEADLNKTLAILRPGMKGIGKIEIGQRNIFWIWTHNLVNWFRVWTWSWLP